MTTIRYRRIFPFHDSTTGENLSITLYFYRESGYFMMRGEYNEVYKLGFGFSPGCVADWSCTDWSVCNLTSGQSRSCVDLNECNTTVDMPVEVQACTYDNLCNLIGDESMRADCNMMQFRSKSYCCFRQ